jgi:hypothetical protein
LQGFNKALNVVSNGKLNIKDETILRAGEHVDGFINNILGYNDLPVEQLRKIVATMQELRALGYTVEQFDEMLENN